MILRFIRFRYLMHSVFKSLQCHPEIQFSRSMFSDKDLFAEGDHQKDDSESGNSDKMM